MLDINTDLMTQNIKEEKMGVVRSQLNIADCLPEKAEYDMNSYFAFGRFETDGHILDYLFHIMEIKFPRLLGGKKYQSVVTILDETTGEYYAKDYFYKAKEVSVNTDKFYLKMPNGLMEGTWDNMHIIIDEKPANFHLDTHTKAIHYPVTTCGTSVFELLGMTIHQLSVPYMTTNGFLEWNGQRYELTNTGYTWFDRQWQNTGDMNNAKWSWMAIYLDNGEIISVLDCDVPGFENSLFSNLLLDGSQINGMNSQGELVVNPFKKGESEYYYNSKAKQNYPSHWVIEVPKIDTKLEVQPFKKEQDITSVISHFSKYEGVCEVKGTYKGRNVTGTALVELIGSWPI